MASLRDTWPKYGPATALAFASVVFSASALFAQKIGALPPPRLEEFIQAELRESNPDVLKGSKLSFPGGKPRLAPPAPPRKMLMEKLPEDDPRIEAYREQLRAHIEAVRLIGESHEQHRRDLSAGKRLQLFSGNQRLARFSYVAERAVRWNGAIFWAPASRETDPGLRHADEVRSVFGPIPPFDVTQLGRIERPGGWISETAALFAEVDGNRIELKENRAKPGNPLEFEHRDLSGTFVKWTPDIPRCDKPSLAGGVTPCGTASRLGRTVKGNVEWLALARKSTDVEPLAADIFWSQDNPNYTFLGYIGFNRRSGEVAFFDGASNFPFSWAAPTVAPGGFGYSDADGRAISARTYDPQFAVNCTGCHDNKEPRIITPYIKQARVGYRSSAAAAALSTGALLPDMMRGPRTPYRVIGSGFTAAHQSTIAEGRVVDDPSGRCTACHGLTNLNTARFAADAVARLGDFAGSADEDAYRTAWALRSGQGKIHPWMLPPPHGNTLSTEPPAPELSDDEWARLLAVLRAPPADALKIYTSAPAPESAIRPETRLADPFRAENFTLALSPNRDGIAEMMPHEIQLGWTYLNGLGDIPERDDVRFHVAIREVDIPPGGGASPAADYPTLAEMAGAGASELAEGVFTDGRNIIFKDVSHAGHQKWTDATPTSVPRPYRLIFPADRRKRYLIRVTAKRHSFDQDRELYSDKLNLFSIDTP